MISLLTPSKEACEYLSNKYLINLFAHLFVVLQCDITSIYFVPCNVDTYYMLPPPLVIVSWYPVPISTLLCVPTESLLDMIHHLLDNGNILQPPLNLNNSQHPEGTAEESPSKIPCGCSSRHYCSNREVNKIQHTARWYRMNIHFLRRRSSVLVAKSDGRYNGTITPSRSQSVIRPISAYMRIMVSSKQRRHLNNGGKQMNVLEVWPRT